MKGNSRNCFEMSVLKLKKVVQPRIHLYGVFGLQIVVILIHNRVMLSGDELSFKHYLRGKYAAFYYAARKR